jgi:hypothetical protein
MVSPRAACEYSTTVTSSPFCLQDRTFGLVKLPRAQVKASPGEAVLNAPDFALLSARQAP